MLYWLSLCYAVPNNTDKSISGSEVTQKKRVTGGHVEGGSQGRPLGRGDISAEA